MIEISTWQIHERPTITVLSIKDAADAASAGEIRTRAKQAIMAGTRDLIIDLSETLYVSVAGLVAIIYIHELLIATRSQDESHAKLERGHKDVCRSTHLKLVNPPPSMLHALRARGLDMYLEIHPTLKDAIASFGLSES